MTTLVTTPAALAGDRLEVDGADYRHLFRARRMKVGDTLRLVDGEGAARAGTVVAIDRRRGVVEVGEPVAANEPSCRLELLVGALRPERAAWLVEKATEVGVTAVRWVQCERSPRQYGVATLARFRRVAVSAVEQCGRARVPVVDELVPVDALESTIATAPRALLLDPKAGEPLSALPAADVDTLLAIGPEGGWSRQERERMEALECHPVSLGARVLRVETAAVVGAALILANVDRAGAGE